LFKYETRYRLEVLNKQTKKEVIYVLNCIEAETFVVTLDDCLEVELVNEITLEDIKQIGIENGIADATVRNGADKELEENDFPVKEDLRMYTVNKAG
jgi:hypothetical protein